MADVAHLGVKRSNILLTHDGCAKFANIGLAQSFSPKTQPPGYN